MPTRSPNDPNIVHDGFGRAGGTEGTKQGRGSGENCEANQHANRQRNGKGLQKLSNLIDVSLANHTDIQNSTKKLGEAAEVISKVTEDVSKNLVEASDTSNKLTNMVRQRKPGTHTPYINPNVM